MARRSLNPAAQPFEVKVGLGFGAFGGMYRLGEPSMCPAHRHRRLINVRLGGKDIVSRPGLDTKWLSPDGEPVVGMIEQFKAKAGKIWFGPFGEDIWPNGADPTVVQYLYNALILDNEFPVPGGAFADQRMSGKYILGYLPQQVTEQSLLSAAEAVQTIYSWRRVGPVSHMPYVFTHADSINLPPGKVLIETFRPYAIDAGFPGVNGANSHTHEHIAETVISDAGTDYCGIFADEQQWGCCLDPPLLFQGKWLVVGSIIPVLHNPSVLAGTPNPEQNQINTGQQVFEVVFDAGLAEPSPGLAALVAAGTYDAEGLDNFFAGSLTELFRMPGQSYDRIPTRADGGMDGKTIRSMCVRSTRNDHPLTAAEITSEKLYIGTFGGYPLLPAYWQSAGARLVWPIHTITDGEAYSFDGTTVKLETTGLGAAVVVCALPDGAILACGRTAAKMLDPSDETWKPVAYNPVYSSLPYYWTPPAGVPAVPGFADADWRSKGFLWTDRVVYRGEAYFVGLDTARLALNSLSGTNLYEGGIVPPSAPGDEYIPTCDSWVLYRFNRATLEMVEVRRGDDIYTALRPTRFPTAPVNPFAADACPGGGGLPAACLAVWNDKLYYSWSLGLNQVGVIGPAYGIGRFDGTTFVDDAAFYHNVNAFVGDIEQPVPVDLLPSSRGLFVVLDPRFAGSPVLYPPGLRVWDGAALVFLNVQAASFRGSRLFIGPS